MAAKAIPWVQLIFGVPHADNCDHRGGANHRTASPQLQVPLERAERLQRTVGRERGVGPQCRQFRVDSQHWEQLQRPQHRQRRRLSVDLSSAPFATTQATAHSGQDTLRSDSST